MNLLPDSLMNSLTDIKGFNKQAFEKVHVSGQQVTSIRLNPRKLSGFSKALSFREGLGEAVPWSDYGFYLNKRPFFTFDPLFHAGCYYVQEASSMFLEQALKQAIDLSQPLKVLDLCAAPGGKSTHIQSLISDESLLVTNDVIKSRSHVLKDNMIKWGYSNTVVTNNDPKDFTKLSGYFDVIVIDAPCSGSGLFRRDHEAIEEWSLNNVALCSQRQQRILADVWPALKEGGILIYSTCSYSKEEDEDILDWISKEMTVENVQLSIADWGIVESGGGYRFWPDKVKGEGFFLACFRKTGAQEETTLKIRNRPTGATKKEIELLSKWINNKVMTFIKHEETVYAWPTRFENDFIFLLNQLRVTYSGTIIGELVRDKLIPHHALAMSNLLNDDITRSDLDYDSAIRYLQRKDLSLEIKDKGWQGVSYEGQLLGWMNVLPGRINNYYPKELRILKDN